MEVQLGAIFAGVAAWARHPKHQCVVEHNTGVIAQTPEGRLARLRQVHAKRRQGGSYERAT